MRLQSNGHSGKRRLEGTVIERTSASFDGVDTPIQSAELLLAGDAIHETILLVLR